MKSAGLHQGAGAMFLAFGAIPFSFKYFIHSGSSSRSNYRLTCYQGMVRQSSAPREAITLQ